MYHISCMQSPADDWFHILDIINSAKIIINMHMKQKKRQEISYFKVEGSHPDFSI